MDTLRFEAAGLAERVSVENANWKFKRWFSRRPGIGWCWRAKHKKTRLRVGGCECPGPGATSGEPVRLSVGWIEFSAPRLVHGDNHVPIQNEAELWRAIRLAADLAPVEWWQDPEAWTLKRLDLSLNIALPVADMIRHFEHIRLEGVRYPKFFEDKGPGRIESGPPSYSGMKWGCSRSDRSYSFTIYDPERKRKRLSKGRSRLEFRLRGPVLRGLPWGLKAGVAPTPQNLSDLRALRAGATLTAENLSAVFANCLDRIRWPSDSAPGKRSLADLEKSFQNSKSAKYKRDVLRPKIRAERLAQSGFRGRFAKALGSFRPAWARCFQQSRLQGAPAGVATVATSDDDSSAPDGPEDGPPPTPGVAPGVARPGVSRRSVLGRSDAESAAPDLST